MKKMINKSHVEGLVYENELTLKVSGATAKNPNVEYINGTLHIETTPNNVVAVNFFESAKTSKGADNGKFATLKTLLGCKTIMSDGRDAATAIKIDSAIDLNEWFNKQDVLVSTPRNFNGFIHVVPKVNPAATFETDVLIKVCVPEMAKEADGSLVESGRLIVDGFIFNFAGKIMPVKFIVETPAGIKFFEALEPNTFTKVWGNQVSTTVKSERVEESAFGEAKVTSSEYTKRELVITGTLTDPYPIDEATLTAADVQKALADREVALAEMKAKAAARAAQTPAAGFGAPSTGGATAAGSGLAGLGNIGGSGNFKF